MHGLNPSHTTADCRELQSVNSPKYSHQHRDSSKFSRPSSSRIENYRARDYRTENFNRDSYRSQSRSRSRSRDRNFRGRDSDINQRSPSRSPHRQGPERSGKTEESGNRYRSYRDFRFPSPHARAYHTEVRDEDNTSRDADGHPIREDFEIYAILLALSKQREQDK